jgi:signal peptidase I
VTRTAPAITRYAARTVYTVVVLVVLVAAGTIALPSLLGYQAYAITTGSMAGTVDPGDLVIADVVPIADLRVGDVITYVPPSESGIGHPITHRIVASGTAESGAPTLRTQGDANASVDPWEFTLDEAEQARMVSRVPYLGRPVLWLADPTARFLAIGLPAIAVFLASAVEFVRVLRGRDLPVATLDA